MENVTITYVGDKVSKSDTITGSRIHFPRHQPVDIPSAIAFTLLQYPDTWIKYEQLEQHIADKNSQEKQREVQDREAASQEAAIAEQQSYIVPTLNGDTDISKYTRAQLETLSEAEDLHLVKAPGQTVTEYRDLIRDALKAKAAAAVSP